MNKSFGTDEKENETKKNGKEYNTSTPFITGGRICF